MNLRYLDILRTKKEDCKKSPASDTRVKNLLAFSGGVDSSALFHALLEHQIPFDIAIVNYAVRAQSSDEVAYAKELAKTYGKRVFVHNAKHISSNFEHNARTIRYEFFHSLCKEHHYSNLIVAHQLNDRLEWLLMQLCRGSGICGLSGFRGVQESEDFYIVRPMCEISRDEIVAYLHAHNIKFFTDESNEDMQFTRNYIRLEFANKLLARHKSGILQTLEILNTQVRELFIAPMRIAPMLFVAPLHSVREINLQSIDSALKSLGYVMSVKQRKELVRLDYHIEICKTGECFIVGSSRERIFITKRASKKKISMPKHIKEQYRVKKIPKNIRPALFEAKIYDKALEQMLLKIQNLAR